MEETYLRFFHLTEQIFEELDSHSLILCRYASHSWQRMVDNQKVVPIRKIKLLTNCSQVSVKNILQKKNLESLIALENQLRKLYTWLPFHYAAMTGNLVVCQLIIPLYKVQSNV